MDDLIEALQIFRKYTDKKYVTHCEHDVMYIIIDPNEVAEEDKKRLDELGFFPDIEIGECFASFAWGSA